MHKHHKIPKHMGGRDDPSNIELLTIEEHTEAHKKLWEEKCLLFQMPLAKKYLLR
jgi:hypothetical protein